MRRILQVFNKEIKNNQALRSREKLKQRSNLVNRANPYFSSPQALGQNGLNREEIVWKLMTSISIDGNIMTQLCRSMQHLEKDSEI